MRQPHPNSPNGCWKRHGYRTEIARTEGSMTLRSIYAPDGTQVLANADYEMQNAYCRDHGLFLPEAMLGSA